MDHVRGYTIINDMTARERQRDHKQFYLGKSPDTFCPMGPIAVPASKLDKHIRVQTFVNGDLRQDSTTESLIFSIPFLIKTLSEGQTLQPGDVLATGTPAGVGIGCKPPTFLQLGDEISITVSLFEGNIQGTSSRQRHLEVLPAVGHWHVFEDSAGVAKLIISFLCRKHCPESLSDCIEVDKRKEDDIPWFDGRVAQTSTRQDRTNRSSLVH